MTYHRPGALGTTRVRLTRGRRRVLLALLGGAENLHGPRLCAAAQVGSWALYPFLDHLRAAGWAVGEARIIEQRKTRCYRLTDKGRAHAAAALGLIYPVHVP
jgi:DNA-binding PadR family transcriptional regulator